MITLFSTTTVYLHDILVEFYQRSQVETKCADKEYVQRHTIYRHIFMPRHEMAGAYNVTLFRHSFLPSFHPSVILSIRHHQFPFIILRTVAHIQLKFDIWICHKIIQVKFEFGHGSMIFSRIMPLLL
jgi:hypothetical protein